MEVKLLEEKGNTVKFLFKGTTHIFMNALRRQIMAGTPVLAIEEVHIYQNTGVMFDEMFSHRLAMVPLKHDPKRYKLGDKVKLVIEKEGPCTVYSKDIKSTDPKIEPAELNILLTKLREGKKIKMELDAVVGIGKEHAKWQPAIVSFQELPIVTGEGKKKGKSYKADMIETLLDGKQRDLILDEGQKVEYDPTTFIFTVESHGNISVKELFESAIEGLTSKSKEFRGELKNLS